MSRIINVIAILQKCGLTHLGNQSHLYLYGHRTINFADNRNILLSTIGYNKRDSTLFNVSLVPYPFHPTMSQPHLSFITFILHTFVPIFLIQLNSCNPNSYNSNNHVIRTNFPVPSNFPIMYGNSYNSNNHVILTNFSAL